jgi:hypothetical protein
LPLPADAGARATGPAGPQVVFLPALVAKEIDGEVRRTNRTREALIERAWTTAGPRLAKMDAGPEPDGG